RLRLVSVVQTGGQGNPMDVPRTIHAVAKLLGRYPLFGICLGHQVLALACGADTEKMKFGHRGGNHPVKDLESGRTVITSQNHGYAVKKDRKRTRLNSSHVKRSYAGFCSKKKNGSQG